MELEKIPNKVRYEYSLDSNCHLQFSHGVWGGINPQGEIEINFYVESDKLPPFSERTIEAGGTLGEETIPREEEQHIVSRHIHSRVLITQATAHALIEWLQEKVELLDNDEPSAFSAGNFGHEVQQ